MGYREDVGTSDFNAEINWSGMKHPIVRLFEIILTMILVLGAVYLIWKN